MDVLKEFAEAFVVGRVVGNQLRMLGHVAPQRAAKRDV